MAVFYSADLHFGHARIAEFCGRPYRDVDTMNMDLITRWNTIVQPGDTTYVLGDFALGRITETLPLAARLNGTKILVPGNHDRCHPMHGPKATPWRDKYLDAGFADIDPYLLIPLRIAGTPVLAGHFPYTGDSHDDRDRFTDWRPADVGGWILHGHVHGRWRQHGRQINVGVDAWGGFPVPEPDVAALIDVGPRDLPPLAW